MIKDLQETMKTAKDIAELRDKKEEGWKKKIKLLNVKVFVDLGNIRSKILNEMYEAE